MTVFKDELADIEHLLALAPEELAPIALRAAKEFRQNGVMGVWDLPFLIFEHPYKLDEAKFPPARRKEAEIALTEAWSWLVVNGIIIPQPGSNEGNGWMILSRRGSKLINDSDGFKKHAQAASFPKHLLHPAIADKAWVSLARGEFEDAVFHSFKRVEIAVREAGKYGPSDIGTKLMRKAFEIKKGPLTDPGLPEGEQQALQDLFVGAIGSYKNSHSHRTVSITDPAEAQEMVMLASHLLRIVDARKK